MRVLELQRGKTARAWGQAHGESFRDLIREIAEIRIGLTVDLSALGDRQAVLSTAEGHLPVLAQWDCASHDELLGIAEGAGVPASHIVVLNHYTDLRDIRPSSETSEEDCSAVFARTANGNVLGQTWDMHGSAEPYVILLGVPESGLGPAAWVMSITGCVGMAGLNGAGLGVTINNLKSLDARVGVVWPSLVRATLRHRGVSDARDFILKAPLGSGHHYMVASGDGAFGIETSGTRREVVYAGEAPFFVHTNHCVGTDVAGCSTISPESTTQERYDALDRSLRGRAIQDPADLWQRFGSHEGYPKSVCSHMSSPSKPHATKTCAAVVMDLTRRELLVAQGCVHLARPNVFAARGS